MAYKGFKEMNLLDLIDSKKLGMFLNKIQSTYNVQVPYHNDLHGADVM